MKETAWKTLVLIKDKMKINYKEAGLKGVDRIHLPQNWEKLGTLVNMVRNIQVPLNMQHLTIS
jgi:hypothetical protein